jgi:hypothetical protein
VIAALLRLDRIWPACASVGLALACTLLASVPPLAIAADAAMAVAVQSSSRIAVSLLNETDYRSFPRMSEPVFAGTVQRTLSFQIAIPETGHYYLVLDNRQGSEPAKVKVGIRAKRGATAPTPEPDKTEPSQPGSGERKQGI